jgi:GT2 family glycosyltransferase
MSARTARASVSVIIVNWNGREHLATCLPAVIGQTVPPREVIVVDNGSTDGSLELLRQFPTVRTVALTENRGFAGGNAAGYAVASGEYVVLLNNDTLPSPTWLEELIHCAEEHPDTGIVASVMTTWDGERVDTAGDGCTVSGRGYKLLEHRPVKAARTSGYVFSGCAGAVLYKREMLRETGFFDERFFMNGEDTDLAFRANLLGWRARVCATSLVRHRVGGSLTTHSSSAVFYSARNHIWLYYKCMPRPLLLKYLPALVAHQLFYLAYFVRKGQAFPFLRGLVAAVRGLGQFRPDRVALQSRRKVGLEELESRLTPLGRYLADRRASRARPRASAEPA